MTDPKEPKHPTRNAMSPFDILDSIPGVHATCQQTGESYFDSLAPIVNAHKAMLAALHEVRPLLAEYLDDVGGCDHSVNICSCGLRLTLENVDAAIAKVEAAQ